MRPVFRYVVDGWRGRHGLGRAYWVNGVAVRLAVYVVLLGLAYVTRDATMPEIRTSGVAMALITLAVCIWQLVGIWREHRRNRRGVGGWLARGIITLWTLLAAAALNTSMALEPSAAELGAYGVRLLGAPAEVEVHGLLAAGVSDDLEEVLTRNPQVRTLHVNSVGGLLNESLRLANLVRKHRLRVAVDTLCLSGCTLVLLAATERLSRPQARFGFHKATSASPGVHVLFGDGDLHAALRDVGASRKFIDSTNVTTLFEPKIQELLEEHVVTRVLASDELVFCTADSSPSAIESLVVRSFQLTALREQNPPRFAGVVRAFQEAPERGTTLAALTAEVTRAKAELDVRASLIPDP